MSLKDNGNLCHYLISCTLYTPFSPSQTHPTLFAIYSSSIHLFIFNSRPILDSYFSQVSTSMFALLACASCGPSELKPPSGNPSRPATTSYFVIHIIASLIQSHPMYSYLFRFPFRINLFRIIMIKKGKKIVK